MRQRLPELCDIQYGYAFDSTGFTEDSSYPPLVRIRDVKRGYSETYFVGEYPEEYILHAGDLLIGMDGEFNIARWKSRDALLNQRVCKITAKEGTNEEYLRFALSKALKEIESRTAFVTVKHLSAKELNKLELVVPRFDEQNIIAQILTAIEKIIELRQQQLSALDDLIKARFVEMFGNGEYPQVPMSDLVEKKVSTAKKDFSPDDIIKYIDISSIDNKRNLMTGYIEYVLSEAPSRAQQHVVKGDVLISTVRPNLRNVAITTYEDDNLVASSGFCVLRAKKCLPSYLLAVACSNEFTDAMSRVVTGANYPAIKDSDVMGYTVSLPSIELQNGFEKFTEQVDKSKVAVQKALDEAQLLFDSLMQQYFG